MYPGEKSYNDFNYGGALFNSNPYTFNVVSPYGYNNGFASSYYYRPSPRPEYHAQNIHQTINMNNRLNRQAQMDIDSQEPKINIWDETALDDAMAKLTVSNNDEKSQSTGKTDQKSRDEKRRSVPGIPESGSAADQGKKSKRMSGFKKALGLKSPEEKAISKAQKMFAAGHELRNAILREEEGRWPDESTKHIVAVYQEKVGMAGKIAHLRDHQPIQYLHLLRAGYFEPIPVAWADQASNPLKFSIEAAGGWRGITPAWRGYEDTAEERLYWVLNHREGPAGIRMKPDFISEMNMARDRMAKAVEPPPEYYSSNDTCHLQHTSEGYSKQVMPPPFRAYDRPETPTDDTMLLVDVSGSMDFDPVRPK